MWKEQEEGQWGEVGRATGRVLRDEAGRVESRAQGGLPASLDMGWEVVVGSLQTMVGPDLPVTESPYGECIVRDENRSMGRVCTVGDNGWMLGTYFGAYCEVSERKSSSRTTPCLSANGRPAVALTKRGEPRGERGWVGVTVTKTFLQTTLSLRNPSPHS